MPEAEIGEQFLRAGNWKAAQDHFQKLTAEASNDASALLGLGNALIGLGRLEDGIDACQRALSIDPRCVRALGAMGGAYQRLGQFDEAIEVAKQAIEISPGLSKPYAEIVRCKRIGPADLDLVKSLEAMARESRPEPDLFHIHLALGKAYDDLERYEMAMDHYNRANAIASKLSATLRYEPRTREAEVANIKRLFPKELFEHEFEFKNDSEVPVLIVGMIRSGTTLLNEILCRHPDVASAGEVRFWESEGSALIRALGSSSLDVKATADVSDRYVSLLAKHGSGHKRVTDKMPTNFRHLGLINRALPRAKVIHIKRHPIDTCLSIYFTDFGPRPPQFAFEKESIAHAYQMYLKLMDHWRKVLPAGGFLEISYEDLVRDAESVVKKVLQYLELPWHQNLLDATASNTDVATPSRWQARQPIYGSSLERWRNYRHWLGPFSNLVK